MAHLPPRTPRSTRPRRALPLLAALAVPLLAVAVVRDGLEGTTPVPPGTGPAAHAESGTPPYAIGVPGAAPSFATSLLANAVAERGGAFVVPSAAQPGPRQDVRFQQERECPPYAIDRPASVASRGFYFTRGAYSEDSYMWRGRSWAVDFEKADRQFLVVMQRLMNMDIFPCENPVRLDDPHLSRFPFVYMLEVGGMWLTPAEVENFRGYLLRGGFALIDDFWGPYAWQNFEREMQRVLPEYPIVDIPMDHLIFRIVYPIREVLTVPNEGNGCRGDPSRYSESGGESVIRGIYDDAGRLMVVIAFDTDLGDAWEWAEQTCYPWDRANYAFQLGFNIITYAMTN